MTKAVVIFSGGQDSTTILHWAKNRYNEVEAITFNYGQKHLIEVEQSKKICEKNNVTLNPFMTIETTEMLINAVKNHIR